jgi:hypothetical protein
VDLDIEGYARVMAELSAAGPARAEVLARNGLDEDRWDALDAHFQARLSEALDEDGDGVSALIAAHASAYEAAQRALMAPISLEQFAQVTRLLHAAGDVRAALAKVGVALSDYVRASEHWSPQLANDPELERRFEAALRGSAAPR